MSVIFINYNHNNLNPSKHPSQQFDGGPQTFWEYQARMATMVKKIYAVYTELK